MTYDQMVKNLAVYLRDQLKEVEEIHTVRFELNINGRVHDGDLNIEFRLGSQYDSGGQVTGGDLPRVVDEYKRRHGWDRRNKPLCISYSGEPE